MRFPPALARVELRVTGTSAPTGRTALGCTCRPGSERPAGPPGPVPRLPRPSPLAGTLAARPRAPALLPSCLFLFFFLLLLFIHNKSCSSGSLAASETERGRMEFFWTGTWILMLVLHSSPIQAFPKPGGGQGTWTLSFYPDPCYFAAEGRVWL